MGFCSKSNSNSSTAATKPNIKFPWKLEFDNTLKQHYYVNLIDQSISYDSTCEVRNYNSKSSKLSLNNLYKKSSSSSSFTSNSSFPTTCPFESNKPSLYRRISDAFSLRKSNSNNSTTNESQTLSKDHKTINIDHFVLEDETESIYSTITGLDDEYYLGNDLNNFKNFAGTTEMTYSSSLNSSEIDTMNEDYEIKEFDYNYIYNAPQYEQDYYNHFQSDDQSTFDKEIERRELRLQMLQELY